MNQTLNVSPDVFSSGQIKSKIWLCEELEKLFDRIDQIWIYGGWCGTTAFLLKSRNNIQNNKIKSWDKDPMCEPIADAINETWVWDNWAFKAYTDDCNNLSPELGNPDLIINTSTEHFENNDWWDKIPKGMTVALQGNNMSHDDHIGNCHSLEEFEKMYECSKLLYKGEISFKYSTWGFDRYMIIGQK